MTVQESDHYIVCRNELNYRISADRLKKELGGEESNAVMAFYQAAAPHGWEQLVDSEYSVGSTVRTYNGEPVATPLFSTSGSQLQSVMASRKVPIPAHSHAFNDSGHGHGSTSPSHGHGLVDKNHGHTGLGGNVGRHTHTTGIGGKKASPPDQKPYRCKGPKTGDQGVLYNAAAGGGGGTLPSNKTGCTINSGSGSGTSNAGKTGVSINNSSDSNTNFSVKYCNVILCKKQ